MIIIIYSIAVNFKHRRLKQELRDLVFSDNDNEHNVYTSKFRQYGGKMGKRGATTDQRGEGEEENGDPGRSSRRKRSVGVSRKHTVETLVVADSKMYRYHGDDVEHYVLTLMSIVSTHFVFVICRLKLRHVSMYM